MHFKQKIQDRNKRHCCSGCFPKETSKGELIIMDNQAGRRRHRNRGAAARARRNQRAAASQAALSALAEVDPPPPRPLCHLLSPSPTSRRRRVMSVGRPEMPTFSSLNLDGSSSPSPDPPPCSPPSPWICYDECKNDEHCEICYKCLLLCPDHHGCRCDHGVQIFECDGCVQDQMINQM